MRIEYPEEKSIPHLFVALEAMTRAYIPANPTIVRMDCPNCGATSNYNSSLCGPCGTNLMAPNPSEPSLGASVNPSPGESRIDEVKAVLKNAIALVRNPVAYMTQNKDQKVSVNSLMINYVAILALVPLVGRLLGDLLYYSGGGVGYAIAGAIVAYILDVIAVFVVGIIIWKLAPSFKTSTDQSKATCWRRSCTPRFSSSGY